MPDHNQILEIKRRMEQEHRLDLEALDRLLRFLPDASNGVKPKTVEIKPSNSGESDDLSAFDMRIKEIIDGDYKRDFSVVDILSALEASGNKPNAARPESAVNRALSRLVSAHVIQVSRQPKGRRAGLYKSSFRADMDLLSES